MRIQFRGPWAPASRGVGGTRPGADDAAITIENSTWAPHDLFVEAGCQRGFLHHTTAAQLAISMLKVLASIPPTALPLFVLEVTDPKGGKHFYPGVIELTEAGGSWSAWGINTPIVPPHSTKGFSFRFIPDLTLERLRKLLAHLKEVNIIAPESPSP